MIYFLFLVTGLVFSDATKDVALFKNAYQCNQLVVANGRNKIVESFYVKDGRPQPLDQVIDPVIAQLRADKRISSVGKEGLQKIQDDLLKS